MCCTAAHACPVNLTGHSLLPPDPRCRLPLHGSFPGNRPVPRPLQTPAQGNRGSFRACAFRLSEVPHLGKAPPKSRKGCRCPHCSPLISPQSRLGQFPGSLSPVDEGYLRSVAADTPIKGLTQHSVIPRKEHTPAPGHFDFDFPPPKLTPDYVEFPFQSGPKSRRAPARNGAPPAPRAARPERRQFRWSRCHVPHGSSRAVCGVVDRELTPQPGGPSAAQEEPHVRGPVQSGGEGEGERAQGELPQEARQRGVRGVPVAEDAVRRREAVVLVLRRDWRPVCLQAPGGDLEVGFDLFLVLVGFQ